MGNLGQRLADARAEVARLERLAQSATCAEIGCNMQSIGGCNCGCEFPDGWGGQCSVPVFQCSRCGDCDYGQNDEARETRARCAAEFAEDTATPPQAQDAGQSEASPARTTMEAVMADKQRIIELQRSLKIARDALETIQHRHWGGRNPESIAEDALDRMRPLDRKLPLQGLVGHERRPRP